MEADRSGDSAEPSSNSRDDGGGYPCAAGHDNKGFGAARVEDGGAGAELTGDAKHAATLAKLDACQTHFQLLGLPHGPVLAKEVKAAYRRVVLLVHPDKNPLPGAVAAFQRVSAAFECLLNPVAQAEYLRTTHKPRRDKVGDGGGGASRRKRKRGGNGGHNKRADPRTRQSRRAFVAAVEREVDAQRTTQETRKTGKAARRAARAMFVRDTIEAAVLNDEALERVAATARSWSQWRSVQQARRARKAGRDGLPPPAGHAGNGAATSEAGESDTGAGAGAGGGGGADGGGAGVGRGKEGGATPAAGSSASVPAADLCCMLCRRKFVTREGLSRHFALSEMHKAAVNAQAMRDLLGAHG